MAVWDRRWEGVQGISKPHLVWLCGVGVVSLTQLICHPVLHVTKEHSFFVKQALTYLAGSIVRGGSGRGS